ncbi:LysR family transcriptional regulator [Anaerocolumna sedimenticola]|uniref:LysR family transcriptional regulator n=1 Tax=Anaerocolumna sedimenticola TaxID=2696063 RepID=A0A6P1TUN6_9FIRM|nr:LysR family transcriptional regulator [Anaerocolumna sedimenticola]QHQ63396.1 LysR family transcriptional regulator [Anaerocolumna sedimenticola]
MELKQLQTIKNILTEGSYLKAAEKMGYAPSTVTLHIQQLEEELGIKLFEKEGRRMHLSKEGDFFWMNAKLLLEHADTFKKVMDNFVTGQMGHVRIGTISTIGRSLLIPKIIDFCKEYPNIKLTFELNSSEVITQKIINNQLDIGIGFAPPANLNLLFEPICLEPMDLLLPIGHPLVKKEEITLKDLSDVNLLLTESYCSYRNEIDKHFSTSGIPLKSMIQINDGRTIIQFVQAGIGCSILPVAAIEPVPDMTIRRKLANIEFSLMVGVIRKKVQLEKASERLYNELLYELKILGELKS